MAIERMMPHLRLFRHGDGALALFNGMGTTPPDLMATLAAYDDARARPVEQAIYSGFSRMGCGRSLVIVEAGAPPRGAYSVEAHAGCLSFEFSSGASRIVVNCGAGRFGAPDLAMAARTTAAHSTLTLSDRSSAVFGLVLGERRIVAGPTDVRVARQDTEAGQEWVGSHDGYRRSLGAVHTRRLLLARDGASLSGEDEIACAQPTASLPATLRFHLHPGVKPELEDSGSAARLTLSNREIWVFEVPGMRLTIEESLFLAAADGRRRSEQLVVDFDAAVQHQVHWRFRRLALPGQAEERRIGADEAERSDASV
jgi:uncharacterized heparinase superfamily protein